MNASELKEMPAPELLERAARLKKEIHELRFKAVTEPVTDPAGLRKKRREIARINTVLRQKELGQATRTKRLSREERVARNLKKARS